MSSANLQPPTVLVADDSAVLRGLLQAILESGGYRVVQACNGLEAIKAVHAVRPAAVLMDVEMPVMDGPEACRLLKADPETADLPVVLISTRIPDGALPYDQVLWDSADGYLSKPVRREALISFIDRVLGIIRPESLSA